MIIGIDIGGTTTNIIGYKDDNIIHPVTVTADDPVASAAGALGKFLAENNSDLSDIRRIALTGAGARIIGDSLLGLPAQYIGEFEAIGRGGTFLSKISEAIVVSMGTGTALVEVSPEKIQHWGGTGIGGGTLVGLSKYMLGITDVSLLSQKAGDGRLDRVDLSVGDISRGGIFELPDTITASNFGKCRDDATESDLAMAILNLVYQTIAVTANGAAKATGNKIVILTGKLATLPQAKIVFDGLSSLFGITYHIPKHAEYATAVGASISIERRAS